MKPVNLNKVRKAKAKVKAKAQADENAVRFGRTKAQKSTQTAEAARHISRLDAHKRDDP